MARFFCILVMIMSVGLGYSQQFITISGKIIDAETNEPLAFSTISILEKPIGVVANEEGYFEFTFSTELQSDSLVISMMGYASEKYLLQTLADKKNLSIKLVSKAVMLDEVVVTDKQLTVEDILDLVRRNIKHNYPTTPFEFEAFYRDYKIENDKCVGLFEAAVSVYDKRYSKVVNGDVLKEKVTLNQVRKSFATSYQTHAFKRINIMKELLRLNDVRYQSRVLDKKRKYKRELDGYKIINDRLMYRIKAVEDWTFYIYVDVSTYAVPKIEMNFEWEDDVAENEWTLGDTIKYQQRSAKEILDFQLIDGLYYPKYHSFRTVLHAFDFNSDSLLFTSDLLQEYMVTNIDFSPGEKPAKNNIMDPDEMLEKQETTYDPEFWKHYNILKMHPRDEQLIRGLEKTSW
ncbi:carboxypeptidase-like regulatory domain-containing protein [Ekhidna sp.]